MAKKIEIIEGKRYSFPIGEIIKQVCCDCGSTHSIEVHPHPDSFDLVFRTDNRSTAQRRRLNDYGFK